MKTSTREPRRKEHDHYNQTCPRVGSKVKQGLLFRNNALGNWAIMDSLWLQ